MDTTTTYLGLKLKHPVVASAGPLSSHLDGVRRLEDGGAAAIVLCSLFEEQLRWEQDSYEHLSNLGSESFAESLSYFPAVDHYRVGPDQYLELVRSATQSCGVPIIGSLNGVTDAGWIDYARQIEQAGAAAIELNIYHLPTDTATTGRDVEEQHVAIVRHVKSAVRIPVAVKLSPFFSSIGEVALRLEAAGADGLVLFNRFYQPDFDLDSLSVVSSLELSGAQEIRLPLLWIALLYGKLKASLGATRGVTCGKEVVKYILAGADVAMTTSAVLREGPAKIGAIVRELQEWMQQRDYESVERMRGAMSCAHVSDRQAFERANYIKLLANFRSEHAM